MIRANLVLTVFTSTECALRESLPFIPQKAMMDFAGLEEAC